MEWYGSINNRLEENRMFCDEIKVGTGMTEYFYSDTNAYEVIEVVDQKHVTVREYDHKHIGDGQMDNNWELISNAENRTMELVKRGNYWYEVKTATINDVNSDDFDVLLWVATNGFDTARIRKNGKQTKYFRKNVSFGKAQYYYDYEF